MMPTSRRYSQSVARRYANRLVPESELALRILIFAAGCCLTRYRRCVTSINSGLSKNGCWRAFTCGFCSADASLSLDFSVG